MYLLQIYKDRSCSLGEAKIGINWKRSAWITSPYVVLVFGVSTGTQMSYMKTETLESDWLFSDAEVDATPSVPGQDQHSQANNVTRFSQRYNTLWPPRSSFS